MKAVIITAPGTPDVLKVAEVEVPEVGHSDVRVKVRAIGVNRADLLQRQGFYPPPPDVSDKIPGLEFAGEIDQIGPAVIGWKVGDRVFGLAAGGTYAEYVVVHGRTLAKIPDRLSFVEAAAIPEAFITAYDAAVVQGQLAAGEWLLITAVGSGVGTAAVQIAAAIGARSIGTARKQDKLDAAKKLGLNEGILVPDKKFAAAVSTITGGANVVLELVGGSYVSEDILACAPKGRIILVGLIGGTKVEADLAMILRKRLTIKSTTMRARPLEEKIAAGQLLANNLVPLIASGKLNAIIDKVFPLDKACDAHALMESNSNFGKVVLEV